MKKIKIAVLVDDKDPKKVIGIAADSDIPLAVIAAALLKLPGAPEVISVEIKTAGEVGLKPCDHPECIAKRGEEKPAPRMAALRTRGECPEVVTEKNGAELAAMLSILSDKIAGGGR